MEGILKEIILEKSMQYSGIFWKNCRKPLKKIHSGWTMTQPRFETDISQIRLSLLLSDVSVTVGERLKI